MIMSGEVAIYLVLCISYPQVGYTVTRVELDTCMYIEGDCCLLYSVHIMSTGGVYSESPYHLVWYTICFVICVYPMQRNGKRVCRGRLLSTLLCPALHVLSIG